MTAANVNTLKKCYDSNAEDNKRMAVQALKQIPGAQTVLIDLWPLRALGSRGTYMGSVHDREGALGCMLAQEALLRPRRVT